LKEHLLSTLKLSLPLIIAQIAQLGLGLTDVAMIGWYGTSELAALTLGHTCLFFIYITLTGFSLAVITNVSRAFGKEDTQALRINFRMGLWLVFAFSLFGLALVSKTEEFLTYLGQDPYIIGIISQYIEVVQWMMPFLLLTYVIKAFLISVKKQKVVLAISILGLTSNFVFNYLFIFGNFGFPELGISGVAYSSLFTSVVMMLSGLLYIHISDLNKKQIFKDFFVFDAEIFKNLFKLGWPICLTIMAESGMFSFASILMGWIGDIELAAHGISITVFALFFMIPLGISQAGTVIIAKTIGANDLSKLDQAASSVYFLGLGWAVLNTFLIIFFGDFIISLFLNSNDLNMEMVAFYAGIFLFVGCFFHLADSAQILFAALLRGFSDTKKPFMISFFSYWAVGIPSAYFLSQKTSLAGSGVYYGIGLGLMVCSILLFFRFVKIKIREKSSLKRK
tara:strand:- start:5319 stop:6671 length:1353 start_codon:yes stop_codon:yes gene_type:complete